MWYPQNVKLSVKAGTKFFAITGWKKSFITFQYVPFVTQVVWGVARFLYFLGAIFSNFRTSTQWQETLAIHMSFQSSSESKKWWYNGCSAGLSSRRAWRESHIKSQLRTYLLDSLLAFYLTQAGALLHSSGGWAAGWGLTILNSGCFSSFLPTAAVRWI